MPDYKGPQKMEHGSGEFCDLMDKICTTLTAGSLIHERSALCALEYGLRGFGRLHMYNAKEDFEAKLCLEKLLADRLEHIPTLDVEALGRAAVYSFEQGQFKDSLKWYLSRENKFIELLKDAVKMASDIDMAVYEKLVHILGEVQEEAFRVKEIIKRLDAGGWAGHDLMSVSQLIHRHHEKHDNMDYALS